MYVGKVVERVGLGLTISLETPELQEYIPGLILYQQKILDDSLMSRKTSLQRQLPLPEHIYDKDDALVVEYGDSLQVVKLFVLEIRPGCWIEAIEYTPLKPITGKNRIQAVSTTLMESRGTYKTKQIALQKAAEAVLQRIQRVEKGIRAQAAKKTLRGVKLWLQEQGKQLDLFEPVF